MIDNNARRSQGGSRPFRDTPQITPPTASGPPPQSQAAVQATQPNWTLPYQRGPRVETTMPPPRMGPAVPPGSPYYDPRSGSDYAAIGYTGQVPSASALNQAQQWRPTTSMPMSTPGYQPPASPNPAALAQLNQRWGLDRPTPTSAGGYMPPASTPGTTQSPPYVDTQGERWQPTMPVSTAPPTSSAPAANPNDPAAYLRSVLSGTQYGPQGLAGLQLAPGYRLQTDSTGAQRGRIYDPTGRQWDVFDPVEGRTAQDNWNTQLRGSQWNVRDAGMPTVGGGGPAAFGGGMPPWMPQGGNPGMNVLNPQSMPFMGSDILQYLAMQLGLQNVLRGQG